MMAVNVRAPLLLVQAAYPQLKLNRGCVLNIGSVNGLCGDARLLDYSISKGALQTMSRNLANAHAGDGVRFNHFNVGWVLTPNENKIQCEAGRPEDWYLRPPPELAPAGRLLKPEEIAAAAVFWLGDESGPISGSVLELHQFPMIGRTSPPSQS
jgi:NAD(P)-dependent dehydrogenase (short-subunit alcohol dehydrogenase family)